MTHIDPFAPADSPQHPANWGSVDSEEQAPAPVDIAPRWVVLPDSPVHESDADKDKELDHRWEQYDKLLRDFGTDEEIAYLDEVTANWPDTMPTLMDLRVRAEQAGGAQEVEVQDAANEKPEPTPDAPEDTDDAEAELAAALAKLEGK